MRAEVKQGPDGIWYARPYLGTDRVTGKPMRPYRRFSGAGSEEEAQREADEWLAEIAPLYSDGTSPRLGSMLSDYIDDPSKDFSGNTRATYRSALARYVVPLLGDIPYDELEPADVTTAYRILLMGGPGRPAISRSTLVKVHSLLAGAYRTWRPRLDRDPMVEVPRPVPERAEPVALDEWDQDRLVDAILVAMRDEGADAGQIQRRTVAFAAYLALAQGLRCGEVCALRRRDWRRGLHDTHVGGTVVEKPKLQRQAYPKRGSVGNVSLAPEVECELERHVAWQNTWMRKPTPDTLLVSVRMDGGIMRPSDLTRRFTALARELGLPEGTTMHTLRHTHATWLLMHGYDMRTIQERLRHSDVATTLRAYASVMPGRDAQAAGAFAASLRTTETERE